MSRTVSRLESIYINCRKKVDVKKKEQAKATVLAKAIRKSQKQTLFPTGVLRRHSILC